MKSAILLRVPEAEPLVARWRREGDPTAAFGVPAHVTLLYPFVPPDRLDEGTLGELEWFFARTDGFTLEFNAVRRFPESGVVYLAPDRSDELRELTAALVRRWPDCPPYAGEIPVDQVIPHLTVVQTELAWLRDAAEAAVAPELPVRATVSTAAVWTSDAAGWWSERAVLDFGPPE